MALDATVGGVNSNSYFTVAAGDTYFGERLYATAWTNAITADKEKAAITATRLIDRRVCFVGLSVSETQSLRFPITGLVTRNGYVIPDDELPVDLVHATMELALYLLNADSDVSQPNAVAEQGLIKVKAGPIELGFRTDIESVSVPSSVLSMFPASWLCPEVLKTFSIEVYR